MQLEDIEREEELYNESFKKLRESLKVKHLSKNQLLSLIEIFIFFLEEQALQIVIHPHKESIDKCDLIETEKYKEFINYFKDKNFYLAELSKLEKSLGEKSTKKAKELLKTKPSSKISFIEFRSKIFNKTIKDFITDCEIPTYREITNKEGKVEKTLISRASKPISDLFLQLMYEYFIQVSNQNTSHFLEFYQDLVECTKDYYKTTTYSVTINNYFDNSNHSNPVWKLTYEAHKQKDKKINSFSVNNKYDWD